MAGHKDSWTVQQRSGRSARWCDVVLLEAVVRERHNIGWKPVSILGHQVLARELRKPRSNKQSKAVRFRFPARPFNQRLMYAFICDFLASARCHGGRSVFLGQELFIRR